MEKLDFELEFYKIMKEEYRQYLTYSENLWKLKFVSIGAIISFLIFNERIFEFLSNNDLVAIGILFIPVFAFVIDLKILETGLHLKNISNYLENNLRDVNIAQKWEKENWRGGFFRRNRSIITFFSTAGISYIILFLCFFIVSKYLIPELTYYLIVIGILALIIGFIFIVAFTKRMYKKNEITTPNRQSYIIMSELVN